MPATTALAMAAANGIAMPTDASDQLYRFNPLESFLAVYVAVSRAMARADDFATSTYACLADAANAGNLRD